MSQFSQRGIHLEHKRDVWLRNVRQIVVLDIHFCRTIIQSSKDVRRLKLLRSDYNSVVLNSLTISRISEVVFPYFSILDIIHV